MRMKNKSEIAVVLLVYICLVFVGCGNKRDDKALLNETSSAETSTENVSLNETSTGNVSLNETSTTASGETLDEKEKEWRADCNYGSAKSLEGKVVIASIFANDISTKWDYDSTVDQEIISNSLINLKTATDYLSKQVQRFGKDVSFDYDWETDSDLVYYADFKSELVRFDGSMYDEQRKWLESHIDVSHLINKYSADNILFIFFFNTDYENEVNPWSLGRANGEDLTWEISNFYLKYKDFDMPPASYAHEIMHAFGAHDLYYENEYISQEYIDYLTETASNDIMFKVSLSSEIEEEFSKLDAYYVGIAPRPKEIKKWHLAISEHDLYEGD
ncbi:MAG: hypothetical protein E7254_09640 [Lachnospiraceae bacterium]|nr:hypothetical protein [Lachnospiraceae bacterium]